MSTIDMNVVYWVIGALIVMVLALLTGFIIVSDRSVKTSAKQYPENTLDKYEVIIRLLFGAAKLTPAKWDDDAVKSWTATMGLSIEELPDGSVLFKRSEPSAPTVTPTAGG